MAPLESFLLSYDATYKILDAGLLMYLVKGVMYLAKLEKSVRGQSGEGLNKERVVRL